MVFPKWSRMRSRQDDRFSFLRLHGFFESATEFRDTKRHMGRELAPKYEKVEPWACPKLNRIHHCIRRFGTPGAGMITRTLEAPDDLMMAADAGRILRVSVDMVRLLARDGRLPFTSTVGGVRLFRRADVERLALERQTTRVVRSGAP
jgi:excisionase family DNA binding protein